VEREVIKSDHQEIGAAVMQHWNLPEIFVEIAREHGNMNIFSKNKKIIRNISVADMIAEKLGYGPIEDHDYYSTGNCSGILRVLKLLSILSGFISSV
jgi:HD-like signal output (HDOD) protein